MNPPWQCIHAHLKHDCEITGYKASDPKPKITSDVLTTRSHLVCRPLGPSGFSTTQRFTEFKTMEKRMPPEMGPGAYTVTQKAYEMMGGKRVDVGV